MKEGWPKGRAAEAAWEEEEKQAAEGRWGERAGREAAEVGRRRERVKDRLQLDAG